MIASYLGETGALISARSDDGLVVATQVPMTTAYGSYVLIEQATGRRMNRGEYEDIERPIGMGTLTGERVPAHIWASAVGLMTECNAAIREREQKLEAAAMERDLARYDSLSEQIAQDMDRAGSNA